MNLLEVIVNGYSNRNYAHANRWSTKAMAEQYGKVRYYYEFKDFDDWVAQMGAQLAS